MSFEFQENSVLSDIIAALARAPEEIHREVKSEMEREISTMIDQTFDSGRAPGGADIPAPEAGNAPLVKTGKLRRSIHVQVIPGTDGVQLRITSSVDYAKYLLRGTSRMSAREFLPSMQRLPHSWNEMFTRAYRRVIENWVARNAKA